MFSTISDIIIKLILILISILILLLLIIKLIIIWVIHTQESAIQVIFPIKYILLKNFDIHLRI